jgi:hypothetical protein
MIRAALRLWWLRFWAAGLGREFERLHQQRVGFVREIERLDADLARNEADVNECARQYIDALAEQQHRRTAARFRVQL